MNNKKGANVEEPDFYKKLIDQYRESGLSPQEFIDKCLREGIVGEEEVKHFLNYINSECLQRSYALVDVSDEQFLRFGLYETTKKNCENYPVFIIQCADELRYHKDSLLQCMEKFSHSIAQLVFEKKTWNKAQQKKYLKNKKHIEKEQIMLLESWKPTGVMH